MSKNYLLTVSVFFVSFLTACNEKNEVDTEKPVIDIGFSDAFPANCDTIYFGETFELILRLRSFAILQSLTLCSP